MPSRYIEYMGTGPSTEDSEDHRKENGSLPTAGDHNDSTKITPPADSENTRAMNEACGVANGPRDMTEGRNEKNATVQNENSDSTNYYADKPPQPTEKISENTKISNKAAKTVGYGLMKDKRALATGQRNQNAKLTSTQISFPGKVLERSQASNGHPEVGKGSAENGEIAIPVAAPQMFQEAPEKSTRETDKQHAVSKAAQLEQDPREESPDSRLGMSDNGRLFNTTAPGVNCFSHKHQASGALATSQNENHEATVHHKLDSRTNNGRESKSLSEPMQGVMLPAESGSVTIPTRAGFASGKELGCGLEQLAETAPVRSDLGTDDVKLESAVKHTANPTTTPPLQSPTKEFPETVSVQKSVIRSDQRTWGRPFREFGKDRIEAAMVATTHEQASVFTSQRPSNNQLPGSKPSELSDQPKNKRTDREVGKDAREGLSAVSEHGLMGVSTPQLPAFKVHESRPSESRAVQVFGDPRKRPNQKVSKNAMEVATRFSEDVMASHPTNRPPVQRAIKVPLSGSLVNPAQVSDRNTQRVRQLEKVRVEAVINATTMKRMPEPLPNGPLQQPANRAPELAADRHTESRPDRKEDKDNMKAIPVRTTKEQTSNRESNRTPRLPENVLLGSSSSGELVSVSNFPTKNTADEEAVELGHDIVTRIIDSRARVFHATSCGAEGDRSFESALQILQDPLHQASSGGRSLWLAGPNRDTASRIDVLSNLADWQAHSESAQSTARRKSAKFASKSFEELKQKQREALIDDTMMSSRIKRPRLMLCFNDISVACVAKWVSKNLTSSQSVSGAPQEDNQVAAGPCPLVRADFRMCAVCKNYGHYEVECPDQTPAQNRIILGCRGQAKKRASNTAVGRVCAIPKRRRSCEDDQTRGVATNKVLVENCSGFMIEQSNKRLSRQMGTVAALEKPSPEAEVMEIDGFKIRATKLAPLGSNKGVHFIRVGDLVAWFPKQHAIPHALHVGVVVSSPNGVSRLRAQCVSVLLPESSGGPQGIADSDDVIGGTFLISSSDVIPVGDALESGVVGPREVVGHVVAASSRPNSKDLLARRKKSRKNEKPRKKPPSGR